MSVGGIFSFKECYSYNKESFAFVDCVLSKDVGKLVKGTIIPEAILNIKNSKIKFNIGESLFIIPFSIGWSDINIKEQSADIEDSDFDNDIESEMSESESDDDDEDDVSSE